MRSRQETLLEKTGIAAALLTSPENIRYLTGFAGEDAQAAVTGSAVFLFTDPRYQEQAHRDVKDAQIIVTNTPGRLPAVREVLGENLVLGMELGTLPAAEYKTYCSTLQPQQTVDISPALLEMRALKSAEELTLIRRAAAATQSVLETVVEKIRPGMSEFEIRAALLYEISIRGMDSAFAPIVAGGENSAIPHAAVTGYRLQKGDLLTLDFGCRCEGYCADMTRTFAIGQVDAARRIIYDIVEHAQNRALETAMTGTRADRIDAAARDYIRERGYAENFGHGTGHGVGLMIHELPVINAASQTEITAGMVFTIEPGVYVEGLGGVRIEDTCTVEDGSLYTFPKNLLVL